MDNCLENRLALEEIVFRYAVPKFPAAKIKAALEFYKGKLDLRNFSTMVIMPPTRACT